MLLIPNLLMIILLSTLARSAQVIDSLYATCCSRKPAVPAAVPQRPCQLAPTPCCGHSCCPHHQHCSQHQRRNHPQLRPSHLNCQRTDRVTKHTRFTSNQNRRAELWD